MGLHTFNLGLNQYADLSHTEFIALMKESKLVNMTSLTNKPEEILQDYTAPPDTVDWRKKGCVSFVQNQGQMGQSWPFVATGALEGQMCVLTGGFVKLSEQVHYILDMK